MALTAAGTALSEIHRTAQGAVQARALREITTIWPLLTPDNFPTTWPAVESAALNVIARYRVESSALAAGYYRAFRFAETQDGTADVTPAPLDEEVVGRAQTSLRVVGRLATERAIALKEPNPLGTALVRVAGTVGRHVQNGGRQTVANAIERDGRAHGYARVTSGKPCAFCAMLASRGPVYSKERGNFRSHDHCACALEPAFGRLEPSQWPGRGAEFRELYDRVAKGDPDQLNAFRRAYEGRAA